MSPVYRCLSAVSLAQIEPHLSAWQQLMSRAAEDNFYLSPAFITAVLRHYGENRCLVVFVYRDDAVEGPRLVAVAPFSRHDPTLKIPLTVLRGFDSPHGYLSHPLMDRNDGYDALDALWEWLERPEHPWRLVLFGGISRNSPFLPWLESLLRKRRRSFLSKSMFMRPMLYRRENFEAYLASLPVARRKNYRRRWKQLMEAGNVEILLHRNLTRCPDLIERFLQLEQRSWKGSEGTAMACRPEDTDFFRDIVEACASRDHLFFVELRFNDQPVAMTANFIVGQTLFAFKIAYDPDYRDYSPGILAEIQTIRLFHETGGLARGEGGATGESYLRSYWRDLVEMRAFYIAMPRRRARGYLALLAFVWGMKKTFRYLTQFFYRKDVVRLLVAGIF